MKKILKKKVKEDSTPVVEKPKEITYEDWVSAFQNQGIARYYQIKELQGINESLKKIGQTLVNIGQFIESQEEEETTEEAEEEE